MFYSSFTFKLPVKQHLSDVSFLKPGKTMLISPEKNSIIYHVIALSYRTIYPENITQFLTFYRTL